MDASRLISRVLPGAEGDVHSSMYDRLRMAPDPGYRDLESQRHPPPDTFHDEDDDPDAFLYDANQTPTHPGQSPEMMASPVARHSRPRKQARDQIGLDDDEDVPASLLLDPGKRGISRAAAGKQPDAKLAKAEAQWQAMQEQQRLHMSQAPRSTRPGSRPSRVTAPHTQPARADPRNEAMWMYTNAGNLDSFLLEVYQYYTGHGVWSILLSRILGLLSELFMFSFAMFLTTCIDYPKIPTSRSTAEIMIPKCMSKASWVKNAALFFFIIYWLTRALGCVQDTRRLFRMHDFFHHVLGISDDDIQTVSWVRVVEGLVGIQNANIATAAPSSQAKKYLNNQTDYRQPQQKLTAETIANRLMRQANYLVALYNKDILDFTLPIPFLGTRQFYSKSLEWALDVTLTNFIFTEQGSIRPFCLEVKHRSELIDALRVRLRFAAVISVVVAPFNILRFCIIFFFRYYTEFTKNPSKASARTFTPFAEWKIREFNELDHLFTKRLRQAYPFANDYLKQFPKDKMDQFCRFIAFVSGAVAAVLALATLFDPELFLGFEVTPGRTAVFWLTLTGIIFGIANGALPDESEVYDPVMHLREVLLYTHYMPAHWKNRLHSNEVRSEFSAMYQMKVLIFIDEILSLIVAPIILWRNAETRCERIVDFFREQTVHVEGIGNECNFAVFGFKKDLNATDYQDALEDTDGLREDYFAAKDDKMSQSVMNFRQYYSHYGHRPGHRPHRWQPPPAWPPVITQSIAEEPGPMPPPTRGSNARKSTASMLRSPRQAAHGASQRGASGAKSGRAAQSHGVSESRVMAQDSDLHDFADAPGAEQLESDTDDNDEGAGGERVNAGVLGMLAQFSKAHNEKGTGAVNI
ncbi:Autophagy-related protein 9 [Fulvia fulva]|nr:Autophagy-related protein 9 [Fulvia fulva]KAK4614600.1 Autophagy-related protein 9 [Fulvia fulva]WPV20476.1 Autophagy-related protein 9 [Fulvia fulva]WPV34820.1 Autophagy-related protein 9 [Fulvia fulva]